MLQGNSEMKRPAVLALFENRDGGVVGVAEEDGLLIEDIDLFNRLGDLGRDQSDEPDLDTGVS